VHTRKSKTTFFVLEGLSALAASYFGNYVFFLLRDRFGFGNLGNLSVAALGGLVYTFASWQGGRFAQRFGYFTALKTGLVGMMLCLAMGTHFALLPMVLLAFVGWMTAMCFTWPALEALVCDGVSDGDLRKNIGIYNLVWSGAMAATYFFGGALYEMLGHDSIFWLPPLIHYSQFLIVLRLGREPIRTPAAPHATPLALMEAAVVSRPASARTFLRMAWLAIPFSYLGITTVVAVIPALAKTLELSTVQAGLFCSIWMFVRTGSFVVLWQWTGWHYRFRWLLGGFVGLTASFILLLLSGNLGLLIAAQVVFGISVGLIYYSSLFYSMDVGETKGEHGGLHEAMIGAGSCLGPAVGALSLCLAPGSTNASAYAVAALLACGLAGLIGLRVRRAA
jgi:predicted MFS family arabinose efflux permease